MKFVCCCVLWVSLLGCASAEEPNPLEKADVKLPVVNMPLGYYPSDPDALDTPPQVKSVPAEKEFALEGKFEVSDPATFRPLKLYVKISTMFNKQKVIAGTHIGGKPIPVKGKTFRYRSVMKTPPKPGNYTIEVYHRRDIISNALFDVKKKDTTKD